jgi:hypothetical protein
VVQDENVEVKIVPAAVFNSGTDWREGQSRHMLEKVVPAAVFNCGTDWRE